MRLMSTGFKRSPVFWLDCRYYRRNIIAPLSGTSLAIIGPTEASRSLFSAVQQLGFNAFLLPLVMAVIIQISMGLAKARVILLITFWLGSLTAC